MKPESYSIQKGCINCKHVFVLSEYDEGNRYFCHRDKSERPLCGSCYMREIWDWGVSDPDTKALTDEEKDILYSKRWDAWDEWAEPREVEPHGVCYQYERKDN